MKEKWVNVKNFYGKIILIIFGFISSTSWAQSMPWDSPLQKGQNELTGTTAHLIVVIAIAASGIGFAIGEHGGWMRKGMAIVFGGSIAIGAYQIAQAFGWA